MPIKHTPGPWQVHNPTVDTLAVHTPAGSIAEWPTNYALVDLANARLIAAAPDMLEALRLAEATIERLNRHNSANGTLDVIRETVAKATTHKRGE